MNFKVKGQAPKFGITFSGGGARGISHLGVLKALEELGIQPYVMSGVSSGAIVASFYAAGFTPEDILKYLSETNIMALMRPAFSKFGLLNLKLVEKLYIRYLGNIAFEDLRYPVIISATDINEGATVYFSSGNLIKPLIASSAMPILYQPIEYEGRMLIDGGLLNNLPAECLLDKCDAIIGVHCNPVNHQAKVTTFKSVIERTFHLAINNNAHSRFQYCNLVIEPPALKYYNVFSYRKAKELFDIGYQHTLSMADKLEELRQQFQQPIKRR